MGEMQDKSDARLLREYAEDRNEAAFREIVVRHADLVYWSALRQVGSPDLARDVAQGVFTDLARKAPALAGTLTANAALLGWLYRSTRFAALNLLRDDRRRQARERQVMEHFNPSSDTAPDWETIGPALDEAMADLSDEDREAVLLRYFKRCDLQAVGAALGVSEDAAQKRVSRAVDRLREFLSKRGVAAAAGGLGIVISANAVQAAPAGLIASISAAALSGTAVAATAAATVTKAIAMTTLQKSLVTAAIAAAVGAGIFEAHQASTLRTQVETLRRQQAPLAEQLGQLRTENESLSNQLNQARDSQALSKNQLSELLKLRGQAGMAGSDSRELARLKSTMAQQSGTVPDYMTNAMAMGLATAEKFQLKEAQARLARMKKTLHLTDDQAQAISDIQQKHIHSQSQLARDLINSNHASEIFQAASGDAMKQEAEIKALFTPEQLAAYPEYQQAEKLAAADNSANNDASRIAEDFNVSTEQQEQIHAAFSQIYLNDPASEPNPEAIAAARKSGNPTEAFKIGIDLGIEMQKSKLEQKVKVLESILTPEQLSNYREEQMNQINMSATAMKMFLPQKTSGTPN